MSTATPSPPSPSPPPPWLEQQLYRLLAQRGHAWLLHGPSGLGQYPLALELARAWLCEGRSSGSADRGEGAAAAPACGACDGCHAIEVRAHADLCVLMPEALMLELGWPLDEKAQVEIDDKKRKPSREIRVEAMREAVEFTQRTSARGRGKAVLVYPAERMNAITANTLLKTLEEPPGEVRFVLASEAAHLLLPTLRSRCLSHTLAWPEPEAALIWLRQHGLAEADAEALLRAAGGRPADALLFARSGQDSKSWAGLPKALTRGDATALDDRTPAQALDVLQKLCHDLLAQGQGAAPRFFAPGNLPPAPPARVLTAWWRELTEALRTAEHPFNAGLMREALTSRAHQALNSTY